MLQLVVFYEPSHLLDFELVDAILLLFILQLFVHQVQLLLTLLDLFFPFADLEPLALLLLSHLQLQSFFLLLESKELLLSPCHLCRANLLWLVGDALLDLELLDD